MSNSFKIGPWLVEPELNRMSKKRQEHALEPRLMRLLVLLAKTPRELVGKDDIIDTVWRGLSVTDESLSQAVSKLRKLLGDDPDTPIYIETIRKKGYRLLVDVHSVEFERVDETKPTFPRYIAAVLVSLLVIGFYWSAQRTDEKQASNSDLLISQPLTSRPGRERDPSISPNGRFLVYSKASDNAASSNSRGENIFLHGIERGNADRQLTQRGYNFAPTTMPDNESIVFMRLQPADCSVILLSLIDNAERVIGSCKGSSFPDTAVSTDGRLIAFSAHPPDHSTHAIYSLEIETGQRSALTTPPPGIWGDYDPIFAKDGNTLYFARSVSEAMQDLYKIDLSTGKETRITFDGRNIMGLTRTEGETLFASNRNGRYAIWSVDDDTAALSRLPISQSGVINPVFSSGSGRLTYEVINRVMSLQSFDGRDGTPRDLLQFNAEVLHPTMSDGTVAFSSNRSGFFEIWSVDKGGGGLARLTDFRAGFTAHPRFSPDGSKIAFDARPEDTAQIYVMNADGSELAVVSTDDVNRYAPTWLPGGSGLIYAKETTGSLELWELDLVTDTEVQLTKNGGYFGYMTEGGVLYHVRPNKPGIWKLSGTEGEPELVLADLEFSDWGNWRLTGEAIAYFHRQERATMLYDLKSKTNQHLQSIDGFVPTADPAAAFLENGTLALLIIRQALESDSEYIEFDPPQRR